MRSIQSRIMYSVVYDNINVLDLALWAEKILKLNVFLCNFFLKCIHCGQLIFRKILKWCHQLSDFKAKMHQIRFPLGLPAERAYSAPQTF